MDIVLIFDVYGNTIQNADWPVSLVTQRRGFSGEQDQVDSTFPPCD